MGENRSIFEKLGPVLGVILLIYLISSMVQYYNRGLTSAESESKSAAAEKTATGAITETASLSTTTAITAAVAPTVTASITTTNATTETTSASTALTSTVALTTTVESTPAATITATLAVTTSTAVTETTATTTLTTTTTLSATESVSSTTAVSGTQAALPPPPEPVVAAFAKGGCAACHTIPAIPGAVGKVGPNLSNIGTDAANRIQGYTAEQYIRESLLEPNKFIAPKCPFGACVPGAMPANLGQTLSKDELDLIVNYLLTMHTPSE